jgi:hypothetical protein
MFSKDAEHRLPESQKALFFVLRAINSISCSSILDLRAKE